MPADDEAPQPHGSNQRGTTAFVLGGGGLRGAAEIGMAKALAETDIRPDMVFGTSIGAVNGAVLSGGELTERVAFLEDAWHHLAATGVLREQLWGRVSNMVRHGTHLHAPDGFRALLLEWIPQRRFDELEIPFQCSAACIETSSEAWFATGPVIEPILASCSVPTLLPPTEIDGRHYVDGGVVNSIPISRAIEAGATSIYVMHVGNIDTPLEVPRTPWDIAFVSFEISRRHRFHRDMATIPPGVDVHVLPTGRNPNARYNDISKLRYNRGNSIGVDIERAHRAASDYLAALA